jgi:hypothetical protein
MARYPENDAQRAIARDLQAYREVTARGLPDLHDTAHRLRSAATRQQRSHAREGIHMKSLISLRAHPWLAATAAVVVVATILGVVPVTYTVTTGHDVTLQLAAPAPQGDALRRIAAGLRAALHADGVQVALTDDGAGRAARLEAGVPARFGAEVRHAAAAYARGLSERGIPAQASVQARTERVSTNVYAYARSRAIELSVTSSGRTPAEIEADIRAQLESAGLQNTQVKVTKEGDQTQVQIQADGAPGEGQEQFDIKLIGRDDQPLDASLQRFEVERKPGMTDADVKAEVERQMREAGVDGKVTVEDGKVNVEVEKRR